MSLRVGLLIFDGCDLLDVGGPYEVLLTANRLALRAGDAAPFEVVTLAAGPVVAYGGLGLVASDDLTSVGSLDVLVVPGTIDLERALADAELTADVQRLVDLADLVTSVCTGAFLLAAAGALEGRPATTHHEDLADLGVRPDVGRAVPGRRWVDDGTVVTAAGLSSGIALGLHLVDRLAGRELAVATADQLEHAWDPEGRDLVPPVTEPPSAPTPTADPGAGAEP
jgi:transcriptional regulator GlxA family with amidase domain